MSRAGSWASDEPGRRLSARINRYASDVEALLIDYFDCWLDGEPSATSWREEPRSLAIDKKNLDKELQSRGARAVSLVEYARRKWLYDPIAHALASTLNYDKSSPSCVLSLVTHDEHLTPRRVREWLSVHDEIVHSTIPIHRCPNA